MTTKQKVFSMQLKGRQRFLRLFGDSQKIKGLRSGYVVLKPKEEVGWHNSGPCEEVIVVISGSGTVIYGQKRRIRVKKHSFVYLPPDMPHNVMNTGRISLRYIYTAARI